MTPAAEGIGSKRFKPYATVLDDGENLAARVADRDRITAGRRQIGPGMHGEVDGRQFSLLRPMDVMLAKAPNSIDFAQKNVPKY